MKQTAKNNKEKTGNLIMLNKIKETGKKVALYAALILVGTVLTAFYYKGEVKPDSKIKMFRAGEVSVSLNERSELIFIDRDLGRPLIVDSTLTDVINNMLAAREYVRANSIR